MEPIKAHWESQARELILLTHEGSGNSGRSHCERSQDSPTMSCSVDPTVAYDISGYGQDLAELHRQKQSAGLCRPPHEGGKD